MKKYTSLSLIFLLSLILLGFNAKSASAYDSGCIGNGLFSITTGQLCSTSQTNFYGDSGCTSAGPYSTTTGQLCSTSSQVNSSSSVLYQQFNAGQGGAEVIALQQALTDAGFFFGRIDGVYGSITKKALVRYRIAYPQPVVSISNQTPVISGVNGPQSLSVNQQGTWTVTAYNQNLGNLSYSVVWGDENIYPYLTTNSLRNPITQQSATFTHSYLQAATYNPIFTVTNSNGQNAQTSLSVVVGSGTNYYGTPTISYLTPNFGPQGTQVTVYGTNFSYSGNTVNFGTTAVPNLYSTNSTSLVFTVPVGVGTIYCIQAPCNQPTSQAYNVSVTNSNGTSSNATTFTVTRLYS